jgi:hypothetical protein
MQVKGTWCLRPFGRSGSMPKRKRKLRKDCLQKTEGEGSHGRMARGGHGLPKVATGPAMPNSFMTWGRATIETALQPFQGWPAHRESGLQPSSTLFVTPRRTPMKEVQKRTCPLTTLALLILKLSGRNLVTRLGDSHFSFSAKLIRGLIWLRLRNVVLNAFIFRKNFMVISRSRY